MDAINKFMEDIKNRTRLMVGRAIVNLVSDAGNIQTMQLQCLYDELLDKVERIQNYGFTAVPKPGAEAIVLSIGGMRDHNIVIACDDRRYRLKGLQSGEVAIYTDEGDCIILKRSRNIEMNTQTLTVKASTKVRFETPMVETTGKIEADLDIRDNRLIAGGKTMAGMRTVYNTHTHPETGTTTNTPNQSM